MNLIPDSGRVSTIDDVFSARLKDLKSDPTKSRHSAVGLENARRQIVAILGAMQVSEFNKVHLRAVQRALTVRLAPATVKTYIACFAAAWRFCEEEELIDCAWPKIKRTKEVRANKKRPFSDEEIMAMLEWSKGYQEGRWYPVLQLLADTGRRVSELLNLRGRDLNRLANTMNIRQKRSARVQNLAVPVPAETMAMLPKVGPDDFVFQHYGRGGRGRPRPEAAMRRESVLMVIKKAMTALKFADPERLDTHSLRRAFVATAERVGVPIDVGRRVTGHETRAMWDRYQSQSVGDDLHEVVNRVHERRQKTLPQNPPHPPHEKTRVDFSTRVPGKPAAGIEPATSSLRRVQKPPADGLVEPFVEKTAGEGAQGRSPAKKPPPNPIRGRPEEEAE
ncbi:MAG: tyrosine-type recombinase/integrase [Methyloceanibacter sp.]